MSGYPNYGGPPASYGQPGGVYPPTSGKSSIVLFHTMYSCGCLGGMPNTPNSHEAQLWYWFRAIDIDNSGELTCEELQQALVNGDWQPFNIETVRLMMNMFDTNNDGRIGFSEFAGLWKYIEDWKRCFQSFDVDRSGTIDQHELGQALLRFGYNIQPDLIRTMITKYDRHGKGTVTFDNFIQICVTVKSLTESFRKFDTDNDGWVYISYEQFLQLVISNR
jgi:Ca2+-binding EF-hand superfamily protein